MIVWKQGSGFEPSADCVRCLILFAGIHIHQPRSKSISHCRCPSLSSFKLNFDGAFYAYSNAEGVVVIDDKSNFVAGLAIGVASAVNVNHVEALAMMKGLKLQQVLSFSPVCVVGDSLHVITVSKGHNVFPS